MAGAAAGGAQNSGGASAQGGSPFERCHRGAIQILIAPPPTREGTFLSPYNQVQIHGNELRVTAPTDGAVEVSWTLDGRSGRVDWCPTWGETCRGCDGSCLEPLLSSLPSDPLTAAEVLDAEDALFLPTGMRNVQLTCAPGACQLENLIDSENNPYLTVSVSTPPDAFTTMAGWGFEAVHTLSFEYGEASDCNLVSDAETPEWVCEELDVQGRSLPESLLIQLHTPEGPMAVFYDPDSSYTAIAPVLDSSLNLGPSVLLRANVVIEDKEPPTVITRVPPTAVYWTDDGVAAWWIYDGGAPRIEGNVFEARLSFDAVGNYVWGGASTVIGMDLYILNSPFIQDGNRALAAYQRFFILQLEWFSEAAYVPVERDTLGPRGMLSRPQLPETGDLSQVVVGKLGGGALLTGTYANAPSCRHSSGRYFALPGSCRAPRAIGSTDSGAIVIQPEQDRVSVMRLDQLGYLASPILDVARRTPGSSGTFTTSAASSARATALVWADSAELGSWHFVLVDNATLRPLTAVFTEPGTLPAVYPIGDDWVFVHGQTFQTMRCGPKNRN
ncbi:MAG TPA: hypothetical protein VFQ61_07600 [Polyangiaceae bacterium]|nr:hypothetical protein [Polyangiaceae bacterium]